MGEWTFVKQESKKGTDGIPPPWAAFISGYNFLPNNICENKLGHFKTIEGIERHDRKTFFLGTTTKYKIEDDMLKIYNLSDSTWTSRKIIRITGDTMTLQANDSSILKYVKANYQIDENEHYDEIIISASGCYGTCPMNDISINKNGEVFYFGYQFNTVNGYFKSKVNSKLFSKLESDFKKANIKKLKDNYSILVTDNETVSVTFIKDKKIVKTINDYANQSPIEFYWAYTSGRYLYQQISLDTISNHLNFPPFNNLVFELNGNVYELTQSEGFYLWTLIFGSKETKKKFAGKYFIINNWRQDYKEARTDGQLFKFIEKDGTEKTYDLGFNFITSNGLYKKFRPKNKYN